MKELMKNISNRKWTRIILVSIFFLILGCSLAGEKEVKGSGIGWDGENYLRTIQNFTELIMSHGYDRYAIQRIMPWGMLNLVFQACHIEVTPTNALVAGGVLNVLALALAIFFFFRISTLKDWKLSTEIIAFASLFYSYALLKIPGYYIILSDTYGFLWGIMMLYLFLANKRLWLLLVAVLGTVHWPGVALLCGLALIFLPREELAIQSSLKGFDKVAYWCMLCGLALLPLLYQLVAFVMPPNHSFHMFTFDGRPKTSFPYFFVGVLCACAYLYYMLRPFKLSAKQLFVHQYTYIHTYIARAMVGLLLMGICYVGITKTLFFFANNEAGALDNYGLMKNLLVSCTTDPLCFIESFFSYFGPVVLLVLVLWQKSVLYITNKGLGYFFVITLAIFFSLRPEARVSIMFLPFMILPAMEYIDTIELKQWVAPVYMIASIFLSHVWLPLNTGLTEEMLGNGTYVELSQFPAQRASMCSGHWQNHEMYAMWMAITLIVGIVLYVGLRKKWFVINR